MGAQDPYYFCNVERPLLEKLYAFGVDIELIC